MKFKRFSEYLYKLETIASRNQMTEILVELIKELEINETVFAMNLIQGMLGPKYSGIDFNLSSKLILKALQTKVSEDVNLLYKEYGDIGLVAEKIIKNSNSELDITEVYNKLLSITTTSGKGSQEGKINLYLNLVLELDSLSARYVSRIIEGNLRIGLSEKTILDALSFVIKGDKSARKLIDKAFGARADIGELARLIKNDLANSETLLDEISVKVGFPVAAKLVERESDVESIWKRMPNCFVQPKLDGLRGQIHFDRKTGLKQIYSRNMENLTEQFPDILESLDALNCDSIILDSEMIGYNSINGEYLNFQETMKRKRKYDIDSTSKSIPVKAMCFDVLYFNGKDLTQNSIEERLEILQTILAKDVGSLCMLETKKMESSEELKEYFFEKIHAGLEGIITKEQKSNYEPGTRNFKWIKFKANSQSNMVDTIDVVVLGYYKGKGVRAKFGIGTLLAGVYNPSTDSYFSIGKVGTGITDEYFEIIYKDLEKIKVNQKPQNYNVDSTLEADVWVEPKIIMEIDADEITRSPVHTAGIGIQANVKGDDPSKGLSIRFPRMKIWNRQDKDYPNTVEEIVKMYELRKG